MKPVFLNKSRSSLTLVTLNFRHFRHLYSTDNKIILQHIMCQIEIFFKFRLYNQEFQQVNHGDLYCRVLKMFLEGLKDMLNWNALLRKTTINQVVMPYNTILERSILDVLHEVSIP